MKRKLFLVIFLFLLVMSGCQQKNSDGNNSDKIIKIEDETTLEPTSGSIDAGNSITDNQDQEVENNGASNSNIEDQEYTDEVLNNCSTYVFYHGLTYFRLYSEEDIEGESFFGNYEYALDTPKDMVCLDSAGNYTMIFEDSGVGDLTIYQDRFFMYTQDNVSGNIYSVDMYGGDYMPVGDGMILGIDEEAGYLVCESGNGIYSINLNTNPWQQIPLDVTGEFLQLSDGVVYFYNLASDYEESCLGKVYLQSIHVDGSNGMLLVETESDLYTTTFMSESKIVCFQIVGEDIYFNYGGYAGTAYMFQGGRIMHVKTDGSDVYEVTKKEESVDEYFFVISSQDGMLLYYNDYNNNMYNCVNLATKETWASDIPYKESFGAFVYYDEVCAFNRRDNKLYHLMTQEELHDYGIDITNIDNYYETYISLSDVEFVGDYAYITLEQGEHNQEEDIGWRYFYTRTKTKVFEKNLVNGEMRLLYEF